MSGIPCLAVCIDDSNDPMPVCTAHNTLVVMDTVKDSIGAMEHGQRVLKQWQDSGCGANYVLRHATLTLGMPVREGEEEPVVLFDFRPAVERRQEVLQQVQAALVKQSQDFTTRVQEAIDEAVNEHRFECSVSTSGFKAETLDRGAVVLANAGYHVGPGTNPLHISWAAEDPYLMPF